MRTLVEWTFQFDLTHSHFVRPVMIENIRLGRHEGKQWPAERWLRRVADSSGRPAEFRVMVTAGAVALRRRHRAQRNASEMSVR